MTVEVSVDPSNPTVSYNVTDDTTEWVYLYSLVDFVATSTSATLKFADESTGTYARTFKQKEFVNIELIDKKLDSLAVYVLSRQKNQMEILKRVDEINGLVINVVR